MKIGTNLRDFVCIPKGIAFNMLKEMGEDVGKYDGTLSFVLAHVNSFTTSSLPYCHTAKKNFRTPSFQKIADAPKQARWVDYFPRVPL